MRSLFLILAACGSAAGPSGPPAIAADEVATPTEQAASAPVMPQQRAVIPARPKFPQACESIANDIEKLGRQYAQLINFRAVDQRECTITYGYKTHAPTTRGGWSSAVPQPDPDGVWFYLGIYEPDGPEANVQLHTQPVVPNWWIGSRKVMFLILEGEKTTRAAGALMQILERHGLVTR